MKFLTLLALVVFVGNSFAEYKAESIDKDENYKVEFETNDKQDSSRKVAAKPTEEKEEVEENSEVPKKELVPFWNYTKEKF